MLRHCKARITLAALRHKLQLFLTAQVLLAPTTPTLKVECGYTLVSRLLSVARSPFRKFMMEMAVRLRITWTTLKRTRCATPTEMVVEATFSGVIRTFV